VQPHVRSAAQQFVLHTSSADAAHARRVYFEHEIGLSAPISAESVQNKQPLVAQSVFFPAMLQQQFGALTLHFFNQPRRSLNSENDMNSDRKKLSLTTLIVGGLSGWAIVCFYIHGPAIAVYLAIQAVTSGVFVWEMRRIERLGEQQKAARLKETASSDVAAEAQAA
jgi:hypothetical protein